MTGLGLDALPVYLHWCRIKINFKQLRRPLHIYQSWYLVTVATTGLHPASRRLAVYCRKDNISSRGRLSMQLSGTTWSLHVWHLRKLGVKKFPASCLKVEPKLLSDELKSKNVRLSKQNFQYKEIRIIKSKKTPNCYKSKVEAKQMFGCRKR